VIDIAKLFAKYQFEEVQNRLCSGLIWTMWLCAWLLQALIITRRF